MNHSSKPRSFAHALGQSAAHVSGNNNANPQQNLALHEEAYLGKRGEASKENNSTTTEQQAYSYAPLFAEDTSQAYEASTGESVDPHAIWQMLLGELALQMPSATFNTWVRDTWVLGYEDGEFIIGLPNAYARDWLENRLRNKIKRALSSLIHRSVQVHFRVCPRQVSDSPNANPTPFDQLAAEEPTATPTAPRMETPISKVAPLRQQVPEVNPGTQQTSAQHNSPEMLNQYDNSAPAGKIPLNAHYTFESFVVGSHNKLAHAAAEAIAERPGQSFNPLFIYGGVGVGKTHLLHAVGHRAKQLGYHMLYVSSEQFTNELIGAIRSQSTEEFRNKYRRVDVLLIDDIQFISGKESTQEEFFHTFNHLHASGRQVLLSSDRPPKMLATLDDRLRSRFEGGLQTDIAQPDFETRVAILQSKANRMGAAVDQSVLMMVAERVDSNIRELEGALNRLIIQARLMNSGLTLQLATTILNNLAPERSACTPDILIRIVTAHFQLTSDDICGRKRTKEIAHARQLAMFLLREEHGLSLPAIGELLGGRDHSTVRYGIEKVTADLADDESLRQTVTALRDKVYLPFM